MGRPRAGMTPSRYDRVMQWTRREFLAATAGAAQAAPRHAWFGLHPFIEAHPKAVFIRRTRVPEKTAAEAKRQEGLRLAREIFLPRDRPGIPLTHRVVLKPNPTCLRSPHRPEVELWGVATDPDFYEGLILGLRELGLRKFCFAEANHRHALNWRGFADIHERHGVQINDPDRRPRHFREGYEITWSAVPEPVIFRRIPHYAPVNEPDTFLLNVAKWKAHGMCMTLSVKNEQGMVVLPYVRFCQGWRMVGGVPDYMKPDIHPEAEGRVKRYFENHRRLGYSRYDSRAPLGPIEQEIWAQKTCDHMSVVRTGLAIIEGIYGRDGNGFEIGDDYLTNLVMFGRDKFRLDIIGTWLAGHEPGNVHLFRIAKERGLSDTFNPWEIPLYEWLEGGRPAPRKLTDFPRTPLKTYYLQRDGEPLYHLVNEPFDYDKVKI